MTYNARTLECSHLSSIATLEKQRWDESLVRTLQGSISELRCDSYKHSPLYNLAWYDEVKKRREDWRA